MKLTNTIRVAMKCFRKEAEIKDYNKGMDYSRILDTLRGLMEKYGKQYVYPSQMTILKLLRENHRRDIKLRSLNRRLAEMECLGLISRFQRTIKSYNGKRLYTTTAYYIGAVVSAFLEKVIAPARRALGHFRLPILANNTLKQKKYNQRMEETDAPRPIFARKEVDPPLWALATMQKCLGASVAD